VKRAKDGTDKPEVYVPSRNRVLVAEEG